MTGIGLNVLSYNIHKGLSVGNLKFTLKQIREAIRALQPDLVCLQEVLGHHVRHRKHLPDRPDVSQIEYLAEDLWPHFSYGKNAVYASGHHGNAILSRFPILSAENLDVSTNQLEKRGLLHAVIRIPKHSVPLHVICIHLGLREMDRRKQVAQLCERISAMVPQQEPLIVAGDFNDWRNKLTETLHTQVGLDEAFNTLHGEHAKTFPAWLPVLRVDRIYFRGLTAKTASCLASPPWSLMSDHAAIFSELTL